MTPKLFENVEGWPLQPGLCPCDEDLIELMIAGTRDKQHGPVFHMGPGMHHRVPRMCSARFMECTSITVSEEEMLVKPELDGYTALYANIYDLELDKLPTFQFMTLFHLGEMVDIFGPIQFDKIACLIQKVNPGDLVFFYKGSSAFDRVAPEFLQPACEQGLLKHFHNYKSLAVFQRYL